MNELRGVLALFRQTLMCWMQDKAHLMAAALSYYMIFALAPMLVIMINIVGAVFGEAAVQGELFTELEHLIGAEAAAFVQLLVENATAGGRVATVLGVLLLVYGASNLFYQLRMTLNFIWRLDAEPENGILHWMKTRFLSLLMVLTLGALGLVAFALSFMLSTVGHFFEQYVAEFGRAASLSQLLLGFVLTPLLIALMFKVLPDAHVAWRDVLLGAFVTALLLRVGVYVLSFFMGRYVVGSIYGAAGALVGILFFVYYVAQMLFLGAEFTRVYAMQHGRGIRPYDRAVLWVREKPLALPAPAPIAPPPPPVPAVLPPLPPEETPARKLEKRTAVGLLSMAVVMFVAFLIGRKSA